MKTYHLRLDLVVNSETQEVGQIDLEEDEFDYLKA